MCACCLVTCNCCVCVSHPGTNVTVLDLFDRSASLQPLWKQVEGFTEAIYPIMQHAADGVHLICYSQGQGLFPEPAKKVARRRCFYKVGQYQLCRDNPHHRDMYINSSDYLALLNNEKANPNSTAWKKNFLRIKKLVLIGGADDGVITPWQSSQFGFYDENETVVEMKNQKVFLMDFFGLKTLYARGDLALCSMAGVAHVFWHSNETVYKNCIEKWLT
uniref:palmitoyl-CoA hydrolase n=1 Tax=Cyprinus carpio TaxID=7962 RepID=A0A8C1S3B4_CYPCA